MAPHSSDSRCPTKGDGGDGLVEAGSRQQAGALESGASYRSSSSARALGRLDMGDREMQWSWKFTSERELALLRPRLIASIGPPLTAFAIVARAYSFLTKILKR